MKVYPAYKDSGLNRLGDVPSHWGVYNLKRLTAFNYGDSLSKETRVEGKIPVFGSNGIVGYHDESITRSPCIIIGRKGSFGKVNYSGTECFPIDTTYFIDETATNNNLRWLYYLLLSLRLDAFSKDSAVPGLSREDAYEKRAVLPPLPEQQAIANFLDCKTAQIDTLIEKKQRQIDLLQEQRTALINHAVTKGLNPNAPMMDSGVEWLGEIPSHWEVKKLKYVGQALIGLTYNPENVTDEENGTLVLRASNVYDGKIVFDDNVFVKMEIPERLITKVGDILICVRSGSRDLIGKNALIDEKSAGHTFGAFMTVFRSDINYFLSYVFKSQLFKVQSGLFNTSTVNQLTQGNLYSFQIPVPPLGEQEDIIRFLNKELSQVDETINRVAKEIELLQEYRTALVSEAVTGKIDVREWKKT